MPRLLKKAFASCTLIVGVLHNVINLVSVLNAHTVNIPRRTAEQEDHGINQ